MNHYVWGLAQPHRKLFVGVSMPEDVILVYSVDFYKLITKLSKFRCHHICKLRYDYFHIGGRHLGFHTFGLIVQYFKVFPLDCWTSRIWV